MAETIPNKLYKMQEQSGALSYQMLPGTNTPHGFTEVADPQEAYGYLNQLRSMGQYVPGRANETGIRFDAQQVARDLETTLANFRNNPSSGLVASYQAPWGETLRNVPQSQIDQIEAQQQQFQSGELDNFQTQAGKPPLFVPKGTPTPQQSNAAFQATLPKPTYQETINPASRYPGEPSDISKRFEEGFNNANAAGVQSPSNYEGAVGMFNQFLPSQQTSNAVNDFVSQDPYLNSVVSNFQQYMSQQNQRTSLVQEYQNLLQSSGIQGIDTELINMKNVIEGTEDDIRTEVTKAGGFATESQVVALSNARNKQLIKNYNTLLETRNAKEKYLDTILNLTAQDRQEADARFETQMNFGFKIAEVNQQMKQNAVNTLDRVAQTLGWDGVLNATQGNTQLQRQIEMIYGLPQGGLAIAAQRQAQERMFMEQEKQLGLQQKLASIRESELGSQYKQQQMQYAQEDRPFDLQERELGLQLKQQQISGMPLERQLKLEQIKTEQAQRAKIYADIKKIQDEQKGSILDPTTPEGAKQLATMKGQTDLINGLLADKNLSGTVGPNIFARLSPLSVFTGGKSNFIAGMEQLRSGLNLQALIDAKSKGAAFGALSDQELKVLADSATKIGSWATKNKGGSVTGYNANEKDFKKELDKINNFAKLDYVYRGGNPADVGVQLINGKYYTKNSDGTITEL